MQSQSRIRLARRLTSVRDQGHKVYSGDGGCLRAIHSSGEPVSRRCVGRCGATHCNPRATGRRKRDRESAEKDSEPEFRELEPHQRVASPNRCVTGRRLRAAKSVQGTGPFPEECSGSHRVEVATTFSEVPFNLASIYLLTSQRSLRYSYVVAKGRAPPGQTCCRAPSI